MSKLFVAMYRPRKGNHEHWALYLEAEQKIYEVTGQYPNFELNVLTGKKPESTDRHSRSIFVWDVTDISGFKKAVASVEPDNEVVHWNCQDYVIEVLEKLEEECIVDDDDEDYITAKRRIKRHFGPKNL